MLKYLPLLIVLSVLGGCVGSEKEDLTAVTESNGSVGRGEKTERKQPNDGNESSPGPLVSDAGKEFTTTASGLKYRILRKSDGKKPNESSTVRVHYRGWIPNPDNPDQGREFDSSYKGGQPISFPLNQVIGGWTEGVQLIGEGGMIELECPPDLGYGADGYPPDIPPNATLRFVVELLEPLRPGPVNEDAPEEFTVTKSGLKYRIRRQGSGVAPTASDRVTVHYQGWFPDQDRPEEGREFDSSYARGEPISFPLDGVIAGWTEGLQLVSEGGMIELDIPSGLAYGPRGRPGIPPNADLRFIVELVKVEKSQF